MTNKLKLLAFTFFLGTNCLLGQNFKTFYSDWSKDSVLIHYEKAKISDLVDFRILENSKDKLAIEYMSPDNLERTICYFKDNKLKILHCDEFSFNIQKDPVSYFRGYIKYLNENPFRDLEIYLTYKDQTFTNFDYKNVDKSISLKGAQLHAISKYFGEYTEIVLLYIDGVYHLHKIFEDEHFDPWIRTNSKFKNWYFKNGYDKIFDLTN